jgi:hypothetical protein
MKYGTLTIKDRTFTVSSGTLRVDEKANPEWWVDVRTEGQPFEGERWSPRLYGEGIPLGCKRSEIRKGRTFEIPVGYDEETQEHLFTLYVFEHTDTYQNRIEIIESSASEIRISWTGLCDVHWGDEYGEGLAFECDTWLEIQNEERA